jgi:hypothetical protein
MAFEPPRHRRPLRRGVVVGGIALVVLLGVSAFTVWRVLSPAAEAGGPPVPATTGATGAAASATPRAGQQSPVPATTTAPTTGPARPPGPAASAKKGVSTWDFGGVGAALRDSGVSWYYNWSAGPTSGAGTAAQFVPMIWGSGSVTASNLARAKASGSVLLGFNEPDLASQSNLSVGAALDLWPQLQANGQRLGSPAVASGGATAGGWLDSFLAGARQRGYRVDFITLHWYGSDFSAAATGQLRSYLQAVYDRYHLPIWLTEYALIKFGATSTYPTSAQQVAFIQASTAMLESLPFMERYAWFALPTGKNGDNTGLYRDGTTPTPAGVAYRAAS